MFGLSPEPLAHTRLFHLEAAERRWAADAAFFHGRADYLGEQRFGQQTCFGMIRRGGGNWTAGAVNKVLPVFFAKAGRAAQFLQNPQSSINSLLAAFAAQFAQMFPGDGSASGAHSGPQLSRLNLSGEYRHEKRDQSAVCFWKEVFRFRTESIRGVRFTNAGLGARLDYEVVAFETGQVRAHGVVCEAQLFRELVHRPVLCEQEVEDFATRAFE